MQNAQVFAPTITIRLERHLPVVPGHLFRALSDSAEISSWMKFPATAGPGLGGRIMVEFSKTDILDGIICLYEPDKIFAYTWGSSIVKFLIDHDSSGESPLILTHSGVTPDLAAGLAAGWHAFLDQLQEHLTGIRPAAEASDLITHYKQVYAGFEHHRAPRS
jgi:uncharacterized protein YndB with AHSA1/START domain